MVQPPTVVTPLGTYLREQRELQGMGLPELARRTRIPERTLRAMEEGRFDDLPGDVFVRGFLRSYAQAVGIAPEEALARFSASRRQVTSSPLPPEHSLSRGTESNRRYGVAIAFVLFLILFTLAVSIVLKPRGRDVPSELSLRAPTTAHLG